MTDSTPATAPLTDPSDPPALAAPCSICGDEIHEDRQVVTRTFNDGRLAGIRHARCKSASAARRVGVQEQT